MKYNPVSLLYVQSLELKVNLQVKEVQTYNNHVGNDMSSMESNV